MNIVFVVENYDIGIFSIHATREGAEKAFKEYTKGKSQEWIDDFGIRIRAERLED